MSNRWAITLLTGVLTTAAHPAQNIENIPPDEPIVDRNKLEITEATASATLGQQYAPRFVHDDNRRTKWVCPTQPTTAAPQWIALSLAGGLQEVSAVAVFGERTDNDGIIDAQIQADTDGTFKTVAAVKGATSASWLASFAPVQTGHIRLLITRSGGPTTHTDVYDVELYGRALSDEQIRPYLKKWLTAAQAHRQAIAESLKHKRLPADSLPAAARNAIKQLETNITDASRLEQQWESTAPQEHKTLIRSVNQTLLFAKRLRQRIDSLGKADHEKTRFISQARDARQQIAKQAVNAVAKHETKHTHLANNKLLARVNTQTGQCDIVWAQGIDAALIGTIFSVQVNGRNATAGKPATSTAPITDPLGKGLQLHQVWEPAGLRIEREIRIYDGLATLTVGGRITNRGNKDVTLGTTQLLDTGDAGWWSLGSTWEPPAAVYIAGHSLLRVRPFDPPDTLTAKPHHEYRSSGVLSLTARDPAAAMTIGYVRADEASPNLSATFELDQGGKNLAATSRFLDRTLGPGETVELNRLYVSANNDPYASLESYGQATAKFAPRPVRTGATALWCSWYAHRMAMTEDLVLANAAVAAKYFKPLGFEIMQLDHGWQRGDVTGDWVPNKRFGHGLKWLADQLRDRYGLRLGVWIAPTDVAATSEVFKKHPDWMLKGPDGKPRVNWKWYWAPNPNCYELDASHPDAYKYIEDSFRQLTDWGVSYYKIDFIAASGGEHFIQHDPKATRGWSVLHRAMKAIRSGTGPDAWIRYCQTPPVLGAGLADSAYGGGDTLDAGIPGQFRVLTDNAHALAAGYWLNDRPYHREVCDMSLRMHASVEEARVRAAMMTLAGTSISFSDEFCYLPPSRIRLMQQCLPPGNPPMKPIDLFDRTIPSIWHVPCKNAADKWDIVGLFNFNTAPETRTVNFDQIGLDPAAQYAVFEFWQQKLIGLCKGRVQLTLPPQSSRILSIRKLTGRPQLVGTDMHLLQGYHELKLLTWSDESATLTATFSRAPNLPAKAFLYVPETYSPKFDFPLNPTSANLTHLTKNLWAHEFTFTTKTHTVAIPFVSPK